MKIKDIYILLKTFMVYYLIDRNVKKNLTRDQYYSYNDCNLFFKWRLKKYYNFSEHSLTLCVYNYVMCNVFNQNRLHFVVKKVKGLFIFEFLV